MKVYVISLRRATERRAYMQKQLTLLGLEYEIIDAVDYQEMTPADYAECVDQEAVSANPYLTKGVLACALSHAKVSRLMAANNVKMALVLEDDAQLPDSIKESLSLIEQHIGSEEVISLHYYSHFGSPVEISLQNVQKLDNESSLFYPANLHNLGSAMAYVITHAAAAKLSAAIIPVRVAADYWEAHYRKGAFTSFRCLYPIMTDDAEFRSTLNYNSIKTSFTRQMAKNVLGSVASLVRKTKFPFLFQYLEKRNKSRLEARNILRFVDAKPFNSI
ncbi:glycosyltransferase family 25 protein [Hymenobacter sp. BT683]|uniref:Glycosyltransferase family 25 protein n=1 Tax=Hymenobacter jeongseonensis TaxID=2791027 RepID=A0ABS0ICE2_9BACT|nr:glycosyltransferase family 25 protein [Hymenobacter jeongseonensis]MBF9236027.1 glycosyltransferase family 25 protein [Hymenobacter jeongseonensis]